MMIKEKINSLLKFQRKVRFVFAHSDGISLCIMGFGGYAVSKNGQIVAEFTQPLDAILKYEELGGTIPELTEKNSETHIIIERVMGGYTIRENIDLKSRSEE
jgi:hypothetical protein